VQPVVGAIDTSDIGSSTTDHGSRADLIHAEVNIGDLRWVPDPT
jgi:hypothetical protein